ncbi:MAG: tRNA (adenosine(37)-N6)-threonylcarbamoyltransferase complex dimerization subunit type 1 TsaB [Clostridiaceae bacterium]|jgi:tRNA threonylcarbamoyladenosine biosynthesis protein TsaB|nr:tRNA (adenosine(37)-N6)-threonylcarbamoyltransferase complex dimerization subunit type 1 TsaB [Clostridiaceae bacterium]
MNILGIDSARERLLIAVIKNANDCDKGKVFFAESACFSKHNREIIPKIDETLRASGLDIGEIDVFAAVTGPGSFTGIRVGVCTASGFGFALSRKLIGVSAFEIMLCGKEKSAVALIDALHGNFYAGRYLNGKLETAFLENLDLTALEKNIFFAADDTDLTLAPSTLDGGADLNARSVIADGLNARVRTPVYMENCTDYAENFAAILRKKAFAGDFSETLQPLYLRKSQAERENP